MRVVSGLRLRTPLLIGVCLLSAVHATQWVEAQSGPGGANPAIDPADRLAAAIDRRIAEGWERNQAQAAPAADDAEFLRRTYLNIVGRIPSVYEARAFLDDESPQKRRALVEQLLGSPGYLANFTRIWRDVIVPEASNDANPFARFDDVRQFEAWLHDRLDDNSGFDRIAREVISGNTEIRSEGNPGAFVRLKESKAENMAAGAARAFLGVRLECAQCHNHPFAAWLREDFWRLAAFFGGSVSTAGDAARTGSRSIAIPETDRVVEAAFLDRTPPDFASALSPRAVLANWITARDNAYFARATVNRVWGHFFGIGIVEPVDDFDELNPASHPELLNELAEAFAESGCDLKFLIRALTRSRAYQLSSRRTHDSQQNPRLFARMIVKGLSSDQLFDSLIWATGNAENRPDQPFGFRVVNGQREQFRELFGRQVSSPGEVQTSILQALLMLNGAFVDQATSPQRSMTLSAIIEVPFLDNAQRIETLYLAALARLPRDGEAAALLQYVETNGPDRDWKQALGDVYWALLNSTEFMLNH